MSNNGTGPKFKTYPFTFDTTGQTVLYRRVPRTLDIDFRRAAVAKAKRDGTYPLPPTQDVMLFGTTPSVEKNMSSPAYQQALGEWNTETGRRLYQMTIMRGLVEWDREAVAELRASLATQGASETLLNDDGTPMDERLIFVYHIAAGEFDEIMAFVDAIKSKSGPTEEAIAAHAATFRGATGEQERAGV